MAGTSPAMTILGRFPTPPTLSLPGLTGQSSTPESQCVRERVYYVYILASRIGGTLYVGVTGDLVRRAFEHREKLVKGFTQKYGVARLVYFEQFGEIGTAIQREKQLKKWNRTWKVRLIEQNNPSWDDLHPQSLPLKCTGCPPPRA